MSVAVDQLTSRVSLIPKGNLNRPGGSVRGGTPSEIVIHETANTNPGANAEMHRRYTHNGGKDAGKPGPGTSYHAVVDAIEDIQLLPWTEPCYAAGDGNGDGNYDSINIEICVNRDMDFWAAVRRTSRLVAKLMKRWGIPLERIRQHNYRSTYKKDCPHFLRIGGGWLKFLGMVAEELQKLKIPPIRVRKFPETGIEVADPFLAFWELNGGLKMFGFPIRPVKMEKIIFTGETIPMQSFERARFELHSDGTVKLGLVEAERLKLAGA